MTEFRARNLHAVGQHEGALELARCNAAVKVGPLAILGLLAANDELVVLDRHCEVARSETGNRERDPERIVGGLLDVIGRVAFAARLGEPFCKYLEMIETQKIVGSEGE